MASENVDVVNRWRSVGFSDRAAVADVLVEDVEWDIIERGQPKTLRGIDAVLAWYRGPQEQDGPDNLNVSEERGELEDVGDGHVAAINRHVFRWQDSGDVAYVKTFRLVYTVQNGKITHYGVEVLSDESA
jgi:hypothetical protein